MIINNQTTDLNCDEFTDRFFRAKFTGKIDERSEENEKTGQKP